MPTCPPVNHHLCDLSSRPYTLKTRLRPKLKRPAIRKSRVTTQLPILPVLPLHLLRRRNSFRPPSSPNQSAVTGLHFKKLSMHCELTPPSTNRYGHDGNHICGRIQMQISPKISLSSCGLSSQLLTLLWHAFDLIHKVPTYAAIARSLALCAPCCSSGLRRCRERC